MADKVVALVVGAGPVGLTMAMELRRYGVDLRIVDKSASRTDKSKALVLWSRSLELIERVGCVDRFLAAGVPAHGARISNGSKLIGEITFDEVKSRYPFALMIPQSETERLLEEKLEGFGTKVERLTELSSFVALADGVTANLRKAEGMEERVEADWLIGCDGAHSAVRHGLGMGFDGSTQPSDFALADLRLEGLNPDKLDVFWHAKGILAFFPSGEIVTELSPILGRPRRLVVLPIRRWRKCNTLSTSAGRGISVCMIPTGWPASASMSAR